MLICVIVLMYLLYLKNNIHQWAWWLTMIWQVCVIFPCMSKSVYIITYGSTRRGWKFETGIVQKIYPTKEEAIFYGKQAAGQHESEVYVQEKNGKFKRLKE